MSKCYHFRGKWNNGDPLVICSYGNNKRDAFNNILKARKKHKFKYRFGDGFHMTRITNEEIYTKLRKKGFSQSDANILSLYGHTSYIVEDGKVDIN